jgi:hypothetical protein
MNNFIPARHFLSEECLEYLSPEAIRGFEKIWSLMLRKERPAVWISDGALSVMARIDFDLVSQVKDELQTAGIITIRQGKWPADDPPRICHEYRFVVTEAEATNN